MEKNIFTIKTITDLHDLFGLPKPKHPLISVVRHSDLVVDLNYKDQRISLDMYLISLKGSQEAVLKYGRNKYDFQEGSMVFMAPNQVFSFSETEFSQTKNEWTILVHQDFIHSSGLSQAIQHYQFFNYEANEALHLSDAEKTSLTEIVHKIEKEYHQNIDKHTDDIMSINLESLLKYCQRFYDRQFITRRNLNKGILVEFEQYLNAYFQNELLIKGIPSVGQCGAALHLSAYYLSDVLKAETGKSTKEHIDLYLVNKAKGLLLQSQESISGIAYALGFEYPNHFSKLFKAKTGLSPSEYRNYN